MTERRGSDNSFPAYRDRCVARLLPTLQQPSQTATDAGVVAADRGELMDMTEFAVEQAISTMWNRYDEPLSLNEIADSAILSKFYFSRVFRTKTGTSPGRFLAAIRLHRAKNLLLESPISVTEVAFRVGYNSLGTFTSRFTRSVGVSPGRYRVMSQSGRHALLDGERPAPPGRCTIRGVVRANESEQPLRIYVGAFSSPVVEGLPVSCDILYGPGPYVLRDVPAGVWYVRARPRLGRW